MLETLKWILTTIERKDRPLFFKWNVGNVILPVIDLINVWVLLKVSDMLQGDYGDITVIYILILCFVMLLHGGIGLYVTKQQSHFKCSFSQSLSEKMYLLYCKEDILLHSKRKFSEVLIAVRNDADACAEILIIVFNMMISFAMWIVYSTMLILRTGITGLLSILGLLGLLIFTIFTNNKRMLFYGNVIRQSKISINSVLSTSYGAYKELKIDSRSENLYRRFVDVGRNNAELEANYLLSKATISTVLQTAVQVGIYLLFACLLLIRINMDDLLSVMIVYIAILAKIIPLSGSFVTAINSLIALGQSAGNLKENYERYERLLQEQSAQAVFRKKAVTLNKGILVEHLDYTYPNGKTIFQDAAIDIPKGKKVAIIGESGAGKTTFLDLLIGLLKPQNGSISYDDYDIVSQKDHEGTCCADLGEIVSYVPQVVYLAGSSIRENIVFMSDGQDNENNRIEECLKKAQIYTDIMDMPNGIDTIIGENGAQISGGQRQRIALARALYKEFEILIMDEATAALDMDTENAIIETIGSVGAKKSLLIVTHHKSLAEKCDLVYRIQNQKFIRVK